MICARNGMKIYWGNGLIAEQFHLFLAFIAVRHFLRRPLVPFLGYIAFFTRLGWRMPLLKHVSVRVCSRIVIFLAAIPPVAGFDTTYLLDLGRPVAYGRLDCVEVGADQGRCDHDLSF